MRRSALGIFKRVDPYHTPNRQVSSTPLHIMNNELDPAHSASRPATSDADRLRESVVQFLEQTNAIETTTAKPSSADSQPETNNTVPSSDGRNIHTSTKRGSRNDPRTPHNLRARRESKPTSLTPAISDAVKPASMRALWKAAKQRNSANVCSSRRETPQTRGFACKAWVLLPVFTDDEKNDKYVNRDEHELSS